MEKVPEYMMCSTMNVHAVEYGNCQQNGVHIVRMTQCVNQLL